MTSTRTILVLEDDRSVVRLLEVELRAAGFQTVETRTVGEAWNEVHERAADAAIVDIGLPGIHGWEFIERLRRDPTWRKLPVLIISGAIGAAELDKSSQLDCSVLEKPFEPDDVVEWVEAVIGYDRKQERRRHDARLIVDALVIEGQVHLPPDRKRFSDAVEALMAAEGSFISITQARVSTLDGQVLYEAPFAQVGKAQIQALIPIDETA